MGSSVGLRDSPLHLRRVQLGVGIGGVAIAAPPAAEHHVATVDGALVHLPQMHRAEVDLEGALVAEGLHADVALYTLLPRGRTDKRRAQVVRHGVVAVAAPAPPALLLLVLPPIGVVDGAASAAGIAVGQLVQGLLLPAATTTHRRCCFLLLFAQVQRHAVEVLATVLSVVWGRWCAWRLRGRWNATAAAAQHSRKRKEHGEVMSRQERAGWQRDPVGRRRWVTPIIGGTTGKQERAGAGRGNGLLQPARGTCYRFSGRGVSLLPLNRRSRC